jgi:hypothetical protein
MGAANSGTTRIPVKVADCFLMALDDFMRRTKQGRHVSQSVIELDQTPDMEKLRGASVRVAQKFPILAGRLKRNWRTWLPYWDVPAPPSGGLPFGVWHEAGARDVLPGSIETAETDELLQRILTEPLERDGIAFKARIDVVTLKGGACLVALSWSHLLLDGKGAELLLTEISRLCDGQDLPYEVKETSQPATTFKEKIRKTKAAIHRFKELELIGCPSLGGPRPRRGRGYYRNITLTSEDSARLNARVEKMTGALFPIAFYVACSARAHDRVFQHRGKQPAGYVVSVPIQTRKRGARGPLFHNQVTVLFFSAVREHLGSIETAAAAMKQQFAEMTRARLDESFNTVLELMMRLPSWLFMRVVRFQFKGEICSFFHSHTGAFASEMTGLAGGKITNAYHLPCLGAPPGTGLFFCERAGRVNVTLTWREGCLGDEERRLMLEQVFEDLFGEKRPDLLHGV